MSVEEPLCGGLAGALANTCSCETRCAATCFRCTAAERRVAVESQGKARALPTQSSSVLELAEEEEVVEGATCAAPVAAAS